MRALQLTSSGTVEIREVDVPEISGDEVLVKVAGAGLCHSDLHAVHARGRFRDLPLTLGHETAGTVAAVGNQVTEFAHGAAVLVYLVWSCGVCRPCVEGRDNVCQTAAGRLAPPPCPGLGPHGGMAEYIRVSKRFLEPLGDVDPIDAGPLADAGLTSMHAVNGARHRLTPGATALVIGVGGLGHVGLQILRATTGCRVIALDSNERSLELARRHGADETIEMGDTAAQAILEMTDGYGADAVFDFVGAETTVDLSTRVIAPDGALRFIGVAGGTFTYEASAKTTPLPWGVDVRRSYGGTRSDQRQVIELARHGKVHVTTQHYALDDGPMAFDDLEAGRVRGRAVLIP